MNQTITKFCEKADCKGECKLIDLKYTWIWKCLKCGQDHIFRKDKFIFEKTIKT
jgi:hypothetical protein